MAATNLETLTAEQFALADRFVSYLMDRSKSVERRYMRWLEDRDGNCDDAEYCEPCAVIQRYVERHKKTGFTNISGWDTSSEGDGPSRCARCGVMLEVSPTDDYQREVCNWLDEEKPSEVNGEYAAELLAAMDCINWKPELWARIEPHAKRILGE